jgi:hypothetical protein
MPAKSIPVRLIRKAPVTLLVAYGTSRGEAINGGGA